LTSSGAPRYRGRVRFAHLIRSFPKAFLIACATLGIPAAAHAAASPTLGAGTIHVSTVAGKTKVSIHIPGVQDRVVWSKDEVYAAVLADLDNDGDSDLIASTSRHPLVVWRNTADGFVRVSASEKPPIHHEPGIRSEASSEAAPLFNDDHQDPVSLSPWRYVVAPVALSRVRRPAGDDSTSAPSPSRFGRAPPLPVQAF
jgi:hypothetical protein